MLRVPLLQLHSPQLQQARTVKYQVFANGTMCNSDLATPVLDNLGATIIPTQDHGHYTRLLCQACGKPVILTSRPKSSSPHCDNKSARQGRDVLTSPIMGRDGLPSPSPGHQQEFIKSRCQNANGPLLGWLYSRRP